MHRNSTGHMRASHSVMSSAKALLVHNLIWRPRTFFVWATTLWTNLPEEIRLPSSLASFKSLLYIHIFIDVLSQGLGPASISNFLNLWSHFPLISPLQCCKSCFYYLVFYCLSSTFSFYKAHCNWLKWIHINKKHHYHYYYILITICDELRKR